MYAFVTNLGKVLKLNTELNLPNNFNQNKRKMVIPLYQREYKWPTEKICGLIKDINSRDKFLGNIILDELDDHYEIADGQQRITTCLLILVCLYNYYQGSPLEQNSIKQYIMPDANETILKNDSIGDFIAENEGHISLAIKDEEDCYCQKSSFIEAYNTISIMIRKIADNGEIQSFKKKMLDCEFLILINDRHTNSNPIEQVFLDINEKAKLLDPEDIFKGHCFEKYSEENYQTLRNSWVELKKIAIAFGKFGFKDLSEYLYLFILETQDKFISENIAKNLTITGCHFLDNKTMDQIADLLKEMILFGRAATTLCDNIKKDEYRFVDICPDGRRFQYTSDHVILKRMFSEMLLYSDAKYQKLPVFFFLYKLFNDEELHQIITYDAFKRITTNLYIYNFVFAFFGSQKKAKKLIDHSLRDVLCSSEHTTQTIVSTAKELRKIQIENAIYHDENRKSVLFFVDSVIDFYSAQDNWMRDIYFDDSICKYNLEHFVIPDDRRRRVTWIGNENSFDIVLSKEFVTDHKKTLVNFVVLDRDLNRQIGRKDIIQKIIEIREWYNNRTQSIPKHVQLYIDHIEHCEKYHELKLLKENGANQEVIKQVYFEFLDEYFSDDKQTKLIQLTRQKFVNSFMNTQEIQ